MKYYFVCYAWRYHGEGELCIANIALSVHPLSWLKVCHRKYPKEYNLISWQEIDKEQYEHWINFGEGIVNE